MMNQMGDMMDEMCPGCGWLGMILGLLLGIALLVLIVTAIVWLVRSMGRDGPRAPGSRM
jgi:hypothetical protein